MADSFIVACLILIMSVGRHWAQRQLRAGIGYVSGASILMKLLSTLGGVLGRLRGDAGNPRPQWQISPQALHQF